MKIDHANRWWPSIADAIGKGYIAIDEQVDESQRVFKSVFDYSPTGIGLISPDISWLDVNESLVALNDLKEMIDLQVNQQNFFTRCELEPMIRQVWKLLSPQIEEKDAHLSLNLSVPVINYVKVYLENILFNLINNAITYARPDVVPEIKIATWNEDDNVVLMVQDNGIGIDLSKHQEQLFRYKKMFHRGYESNGVSLFKIRNQIRTFGGNIEVRSESGVGSSFYVYFNNRVYTLQQNE